MASLEIRVFAGHRHHKPNPWDGAPAWAHELDERLTTLTDLLEMLMSASDDLKAADGTLNQKVDALIAENQRLLAKIDSLGTGGSTSDADAAAVTADLTNDSNKIDAAIAASQSKVPA